MNAELLDALPEKRKFEDGGYLPDDGAEVTQQTQLGLELIDVFLLYELNACFTPSAFALQPTQENGERRVRGLEINCSIFE